MVKRSVSLLLALLSLTAIGHAQSPNLLKNPDAAQKAAHWRVFGDAIIEDSCSCFVVRDGGYFLQDVELPDDAAGQYAVLIGRGESDRINPDGSITGLPYLYGYMMQGGPRNRILDYLQGQQMLGRPATPGEWVNMWGVFQVPAQTKTIRFFLNHALRKGDPHNGSAARFDDVGLYLFPTEKEAKNFASSYSFPR
jgi:hypothetical protein